MKLVVLSYSNVLTSHVFGAIGERHPIAAVINVQWQPAPSNGSRLARLCKSPVVSLRQKLDQRVDNWQHGRHMRRIEGLLGPPPASLTEIPTYSIGSRQLHHPESLELIASLAPDILLVTHAPLMKPSLYELPSLATLNLHWGIAPWYCGQHTLFWPLAHRAHDQLGITLHRIDAGIDTGPTLAQGFPRIEPEDDEPMIYARCAELAVELTSTVLDAAASGDPLSGRKLTGTPRLYRRSERRSIDTFRYWARRNILGERLPTLPRRHQLYLQEANTPAWQMV